MLQIRGYDHGTPTRALYAALKRTAPDVLAAGGERMDLALVPHRTDDLLGDPRPQVRPDAWYTLIWTDVAVRDVPADELHRHAVARVGVLPAPPAIPREQRLATAPPATLDHLTGDEIAFLGGPTRALAAMEQRRQAAVLNDHTIDVYDWDAYAVSAAALIRAAAEPTAEAAR